MGRYCLPCGLGHHLLHTRPPAGCSLTHAPPVPAGCVVIRFPDDGSRYYLPATDIRRFLADMEARGEGAPLQRVGAAEEANDAAAIEVLAQALTRKNQAATGGSLRICSERLAAGCQGCGQPAGVSQP